MSEWTKLSDITAVATAQAKGWEIEVKLPHSIWGLWAERVWDVDYDYRGRPKNPKKTTIKLLAWYDGDCLSWQREGLPTPDDWQRVIKEDKLIEVTE